MEAARTYGSRSPKNRSPAVERTAASPVKSKERDQQWLSALNESGVALPENAAKPLENSAANAAAEAPARAVTTRRSPAKAGPASDEGAVFSGVVAYIDVHVDNAEVDSSDALDGRLQSLGAQVAKKWSSKVTHLIFKQGKPATHARALDAKVHVVSPLWIERSADRGVRLPEQEFEVAAASPQQRRKGGMVPRRPALNDPEDAAFSSSQLLAQDAPTKDAPAKEAPVSAAAAAAAAADPAPAAAAAPATPPAAAAPSKKKRKAASDTKAKDAGAEEAPAAAAKSAGPAAAAAAEAAPESPAPQPAAAKRRKAGKAATEPAKKPSTAKKRKASKSPSDAAAAAAAAPAAAAATSAEEPAAAVPAKAAAAAATAGDALGRKSTRPKKAPVTLSLTCVEPANMETVMSVAHAFGARVVELPTDPATHLVSDKPGARSLKAFFALARGAWILSSDWVFQSVGKSEWVPEEPFETTVLSGARLARKAVAENGKRLLSGLKVLVHPANASPDRETLEELVLEAGGSVALSSRRCDVCLAPADAPAAPEPGRDATQAPPPTVSPKWLFDSLCEFKLLPFAPYDTAQRGAAAPPPRPPSPQV